ncbi:MAG: lipid A deacylase LpxR family protein [Bacteroidetes bacterium]|nr:lipid A deacylase LpxR family protein [Bacteroidota bacterium]
MRQRLILSAWLFLMYGMLWSQDADSYHAFSLRHDNDINFSTDCYFTSGVELRWYAPVLSRSPLTRLLLPSSADAHNYHALSITHHMYTPKEIFTPDVVPNDHPYSAYILLGEIKESYDQVKKVRKTSSIQVGLIGPWAGGMEIQTLLHNNISIADAAEGWPNQIQNDLLLQYRIQFENGLYSTKHLELISNLQAGIGLPQTQAIAGLRLRTGWFTDFFLGPETLGLKKWQFYGFLSGNMHLVAYNAVLQGGLFNPNNKHVIKHINWIYWHLRYGLTLVHKKFSVRYSVNVNSPGFANALWHHWSEITITAAF